MVNILEAWLKIMRVCFARDGLAPPFLNPGHAPKWALSIRVAKINTCTCSLRVLELLWYNITYKAASSSVSINTLT